MECNVPVFAKIFILYARKGKPAGWNGVVTRIFYMYNSKSYFKLKHPVLAINLLLTDVRRLLRALDTCERQAITRPL